MSYKGQYFVVRDGSEIREDWSNVKFTKTRVFNGIDACRQTFGKVTNDMFVKGIGTSKTVLITFKGRVSLAEDSEGWISMANVVVENEETILEDSLVGGPIEESV